MVPVFDVVRDFHKTKVLEVKDLLYSVPYFFSIPLFSIRKWVRILFLKNIGFYTEKWKIHRLNKRTFRIVF